MDIYQQQFDRAYALQKQGKLAEAEQLYQALLNVTLDHPMVLYMLGQLNAAKGYNGMAANLFHCALSVKPDFQEAWCDLGAVLKAEHRDEDALKAWKNALDLGPMPEIYVNMATLYADSGKPSEALHWADKAIVELPDNHNAHWNRALALLTQAKWDEAWKEHEWRRKLPNWHERDKVPAPLWDGKPVARLFVHGEQGIGDEIMFLSCLPDALALAKHITVECEKRLIPLIRRTWPQVEVVGTQDDVVGEFDAKIAMGDLPLLFRQKAEDFPKQPYLKVDPAKVEHYRAKLAALGPRPWIGVAWIGGSKTTRIHKRSMGIGKLTPIIAGRTCVSVQYGEFGAPEADMMGLPHWPAARGDDMDEQAALVAALDCVVTVQQTIVHLCGAIGTPCYVMTSSVPSWRYGIETASMPWYGTVKLFRQKGDDWQPVIDGIAREMEGLDDSHCLRHAG